MNILVTILLALALACISFTVGLVTGLILASKEVQHDTGN